jgi:hypothetical protein
MAALGLGAGCSAASGGGTGFVDQAIDSGGAPSVASQASDAGSPGLVSASDDGGQGVFVNDAGAAGFGCEPGTYSGMYSGTNDSSKLGGPKDLPISGPMAIALVQSSMQRGEFLTVTNDATFDAVWGGLPTGDAASGLIVVQSSLAGQLDCTDGTFHATSTSADWTLLSIPAGMATVDFEGKYDAASSTIQGTFNITSALATSTGTWSATLEPAGAGGDP